MCLPLKRGEGVRRSDVIIPTKVLVPHGTVTYLLKIVF